jgi:hypothetical protein
MATSFEFSFCHTKMLPHGASPYLRISMSDFHELWHSRANGEYESIYWRSSFKIPSPPTEARRLPYRPKQTQEG